MLVGRAPFTDEDPLALLHATLARTPEAPARWRAEVPAPLGDVVMKLLAKMPDERYQSAGALVDDLARCEADLREVGQVRAFVPGGSDRHGVLRSPARLFADLDRSLARQKQLTGAFERFLPRQFVEQLGKQNILDVQLGDAVERDLTVMFADLRGFTAIAEALGAAETFRFINGYLGHMERAIHAHGGFVHQYVGDGIMAFFPRSPDDAVRASVAMLSAMRAFCDERQGLPGSEARVGIGLHTGTVLIGAIGGADRMDRGVVGDAVNLASRMEGLTRHYDAPLLVSDATASRLVEPERFALREVDRVQVKGRRGAVTVYEVLDAYDAGVRRARLEGAAVFAEGLHAWGRGEFAAARRSFEACVEARPDDGAARLFVQRCRSYEATGAPAGWSGVYPLTTK